MLGEVRRKKKMGLVVKISWVGLELMGGAVEG